MISFLAYYQLHQCLTQLVRFRACALLGLHSWGSFITARSFAPTRTDPADRIHGWYCAGNNGAGHGFFFTSIAFRKWDGKYHLHPLSTELVFYPRELESAGLGRLFYIFFSVVLRFADKKQSGIFSTTTSGCWVIKIAYICILATVIFSLFSLFSSSLCNHSKRRLSPGPSYHHVVRGSRGRGCSVCLVNTRS